MTAEVRLSLLRHFPLVPTVVDNARPTTFELDTGSGVTIVTESLLRELGHSPLGTEHRGRRMNGQEVSLPLFELNQLALGPHRQDRPLVGGFDLSRVFPKGTGVEGILSLAFFERTPVTIDYTARRLLLEEEGTDARPGWGEPVGAEVARHGPQVEMFLDLVLPNGRQVKAEVDTGCDRLILDRRFMGELGVRPGSSEVGPRQQGAEGARERGIDLARLNGPLAVAEAPGFHQTDPDVAFADIIYDAVVGYEFLKQFVVTVDVAHSRLFFANPA